MTILPWTKWTNMLKNSIKIYCTYFSGRRSHCISLPGTLNGHWVITSTSCGGVISPWRAIINSCSWILTIQKSRILRNFTKKLVLQRGLQKYKLRVIIPTFVWSINVSFNRRAKLYIPRTLNIDLILWHSQLIGYAVKC